MTEAIPVILCGKSTQIGTSVVASLKPEYEVVHFIMSVAAGNVEIPALLKGETATTDNQLGSHDYSKRPQAVILGGGYNDAMADEMRKATKAAGAPEVPWLRMDTTKPAAPPGPDYGKAIVARLKTVMGEMQTERKLSQGTEGVFWF